MYSLIIDESEGVVWAALMHEFATMGQLLARDRMCTGQHSTALSKTRLLNPVLFQPLLDHPTSYHWTA